MKITSNAQSAFTFIELLVVLAIIAVLAGMLLVPVIGHKNLKRVRCVINLKSIGSGYRSFANDHDNLFPNEVSTNGGGTGLLSAVESFQSLGGLNEYISTKILVCPNDIQRIPAKNLSTLGSSNLSYFSCLNASQTNSKMFLAGDRNVTVNGVSLSAFTVQTNDQLGWTAELHNMAGNVGLADGSVQQVTSNKLTAQVRDSGAAQRLTLP